MQDTFKKSGSSKSAFTLERKRKFSLIFVTLQCEHIKPKNISRSDIGFSQCKRTLRRVFCIQVFLFVLALVGQKFLYHPNKLSAFVMKLQIASVIRKNKFV